MSKSGNMLRTRRKDNNVKPNRRLDRKSSRGMLYENEELRLKTININAEVERGQSDIKKLKRENDQLRREIWYLRDEYDKLDKLLREKESQESSTSTTYTSESESCSSCTEESEAVETSQNIENVQITNLKKLNEEFDHLSVVPEENSPENSEKNSNQAPVHLDNCDFLLEKDVIKPDQSYPVHENLPILPQERSPKHFFSPIKINKAGEDYINNQFLGPETYPQECCCYDDLNIQDEPSTNYYPGLALPPLHKTTTDVMVKTDNNHFDTIQSRSSFSNGGNLEELLNDIETISHDILKISNSQNFNLNADKNEIPPDMPYRSELNVILMPSPMKLIGVEKYKQIQKSCESLNARSVENLKIIPEVITPNVIISPEHFYRTNSHTSQSGSILEPFQSFVPVTPNCPSPGHILPESLQRQNILNEQGNPFFFGNIRHPCDSVEPLTARYNRDIEAPAIADPSKLKYSEIYSSKANLLDNALSSDHVSSENEENLKFKTSRNDSEHHHVEDGTIETNKTEAPKSPKAINKNKVSIHFKGKKDKKPDDKSKRRSIFDLKKTSSIEPTSTDSKTSTSDNKNSSSASDQKPDTKMPESKMLDGKNRKSSSASPERKHNNKESKKVHKKHKKSERSKIRRNSNLDRFHRERSYSICTDRSNILDHKAGPYNMYDGFTTSDRERTNSLSSCETIKGRKLSNITHFPATGKIPWCGCWGNGCL